MTLSTKKTGLAAFALAATLAVAGCEEQKGPMEKAGENLDKAGQNVKDSVDPRGPAERTGDKVDKALGNK